MKTNAMLRKIVLAGTVSLLSYSASALEDFTIDESVYSSGGLVTADKLNGAYSERITFDGLGNFVVSAYADFTALLSNDGTVSENTAQLNNEYGLYALFAATGTVSPVAPGINRFTPTSASFSLFADANLDTTKALGATGLDPVSLGNTADDDLLGSGMNLSSGEGILVTGTGGFFDFVFDDYDLTAEGSAYFIAPNPFYMRVNVDGDFDNFQLVGTQTVTGDVSAVFTREVPEPAVLALFASGLLGMGFAARRRRTQG